MKRIKNLLFFSLFAIVACKPDPVPKPEGYFRIALPEQKYDTLKTDCPYRFEINENARWQSLDSCWGDLRYPSLKATIQFTYKTVNDTNLPKLLGDAHELAYKHTVRAEGIQENLIYDPQGDVYGLFYKIKGEAATSSQFFVTDSSEHFLRGVLYFYAIPNRDSLAPVDKYMDQEILHLLNTLQWQNS